MREMIDSGLPWIGEIQKGWELRKLKSLVEMQTGFTPDTKKEEYYSDDGTDWITIGDLNGNKYIPTTTKKKISKQYIDEFNPQLVDEGSLLYSFKLSVGQTAYTDRPVYTNEAIASFSVKKDCFLDFIRFASYLIEYNANTNIYGAHILNQELIKNAYLICPPLEEQKRIAAFLDSEIEKVDTLIANVQAQIEKLKAYKQSLITEVVTKGLDPTVPMKDSGIEWIGEIPVHWNLWRIGDIGDFKKGPFGSAVKKEMFVEKGPNTYKVYEQKNAIYKDISLGYYYLSQEDYDRLETFSIQTNDIIVSCAGTIGEAYIVPDNYEKGIINQALMRIRLNERLNAEFFIYVFSCIMNLETPKYSNGSAMKNIPPFNYLLKFLLPCPPEKEQMQIVEYISKKSLHIDRLIAIKEAKIEKLEQYKKSLIYEYVTGKKEVH